MAYFANLVGRLSLDSTAFDRHARRSGKSMYAMQRQSLALKAGILNLAGAYLTTRGLIAAVRGSVAAYMVQEKAEKDLQAALVNTGGMIGDNIDSLKTYAAAMQQVTIYGDEEILNQMAYATNLGVTRDRLKEATKAAIGLAAKYKLDLQTAFMLIGRASKGQTQMLTRYGIVLADTLTDQEKFNEILRLGADAFGLATAQTEQLQGVTEQLKNAWGDVKEELGGLIAQPLASWFKTTAEGLREIKDGFENVKIVIDAVTKLPGGPQVVVPDWMDQPGGMLRPGRSRPGPNQPAPTTGPIGSYQGFSLQGHVKETEWLNARLQKLYGTAADNNQKIAADTQQRNDDMVKDTRAATADMAAAYRRMANDMDENSQLSWDLRKELLMEEYNTYMQQAEKKKVVQEWYLGEMEKLLRKEAQARGGPIEAMKARIAEMQQQLPTLGQAFADVAETGINRFSEALADAIVYGRDFKESMRQLGQEIAHMLAQWAIQKATVGAATMAFGAGTFHGGGTVGGGVQVVRHSPAAPFVDAPRFHGGGEVPAWLQPGERVQSKQQVASGDRLDARKVALLERLVSKDSSPTVVVVQSEEHILNVLRSRAGEEAIERARGRTEIK